MDNFSEEDERELDNQEPGLENISDIKFDDEPLVEDEIVEQDTSAISEEELSAKLEVGLSELDFSSKEEEISESQDDDSLEIKPKKYVIYVEPENINYIENLSLDERREVVNKILKEQNDINQKQKEMEKRKKFIVHVVIGSVTFMLAVPILFNLANLGLEMTIVNYQRATDNFAKLYKEQGKIKPDNAGTYKKIKY